MPVEPRVAHESPTIAELGRCRPLPLPDSCEGDSSEQSKLSLVTKLLALVKSNKTSMRVRERAVLAAGPLCLGDTKFPHRRLFLQLKSMYL